MKKVKKEISNFENRMLDKKKIVTK